ncbi:MAG: hypothetical protein QW175_07360 [Candidatus Bathyarchaeia archaeon]
MEEPENNNMENGEIEIQEEKGEALPVPEPGEYKIIRFLLEDDASSRLLGLPEDLVKTIYDKELAISNVSDGEIGWAKMQYQRAILHYQMARPVVCRNHREEIKLSVVQPKLLFKMARSRGGFERIQQTSQRIVQQIQREVKQQQKKGRFSFWGRQGGEEE